MIKKPTDQELVKLAREFVEEYNKYLRRHENPFNSQEETSFDRTRNRLATRGLIFNCSIGRQERLRIIDAVYGSPVMFARGEIEFSNKKFALAVRDELERSKLYLGAQVVLVVG